MAIAQTHAIAPLPRKPCRTPRMQSAMEQHRNTMGNRKARGMETRSKKCPVSSVRATPKNRSDRKPGTVTSMQDGNLSSGQEGESDIAQPSECSKTTASVATSSDAARNTTAHTAFDSWEAANATDTIESAAKRFRAKQDGRATPRLSMRSSPYTYRHIATPSRAHAMNVTGVQTPSGRDAGRITSNIDSALVPKMHNEPTVIAAPSTVWAPRRPAARNAAPINTPHANPRTPVAPSMSPSPCGEKHVRTMSMIA